MASPRPPVESIDNAFIRLGNLAALLHFSRIPSGRSRGRLHPDPLADLDWVAMKAGSPFPLIDGLRDDLKTAWEVVGLVHRPEPYYVGTVRIGDRTGTRSWPTAVDRLLESGDEVVAIFDELRRKPPERTDGRTLIASQRVREVLSALLTDRFRSELTNDFRPLKCRVDDRRGAEEMKQNKPRASRPKLAEIEIKVRDWLAKNAKDDPGAVTRDRIALAIGGFYRFGQQLHRVDGLQPEARGPDEAVGANGSVDRWYEGRAPADLGDDVAELIAEQEQERVQDERRHKRRHGPS